MKYACPWLDVHAADLHERELQCGRKICTVNVDRDSAPLRIVTYCGVFYEAGLDLFAASERLHSDVLLWGKCERRWL